MTSVPIICAKAPRHIAYVLAVQMFRIVGGREETYWRCSRCGARVKVVA